MPPTISSSNKAFMKSLSAELYRLEVFDPRNPDRQQTHGDLLACLVERLGACPGRDDTP
jgi:hypothetical protein